MMLRGHPLCPTEICSGGRFKRLHQRLNGLSGDARGAAAVEFAIVSLPLFSMIFGFLDLGHTAYVRATLQGSVDRAGRSSSLLTTADQQKAVDDKMMSQVQAVVKIPPSAFTISRTNFTSYSYAGGEPYTDANNDGKRDAGECYLDVNNDKSYEASLGKDGQGGANAVVVYKVVVKYNHIFPVAKLFGGSSQEVLSAQTVLRNQPYARSGNYTYVAPSVVCA